MTPETLLKGNQIFSKIQCIKDEIKTLQTAYDNPTTVRFGTSFQVSSTVVFSENIYFKMIKDQIEENHKSIEKYEKELLDL